MPRRFPRRARTALACLALLALAACGPDGSDTGQDAAAGAPGAEFASLPAGLWTTRVTPARVSAVVSDGRAHLALSCAGERRIALRYAPAETPGRAREIALSAGSPGTAALGLALAARTERPGVLAATVEGDPERLRLLGLLLSGRGLRVAAAPTPSATMPTNGAREAIETALRPHGCLRGVENAL
ncbi:MAG: hypothetical protein AAF074_18790 [Pseudomonadota bacterium]